MAAETSSPAREPPSTTSNRGRGRGGRGGRGRGRGGGRGAPNAALSKSAPASRGRGGPRRGRVKNFSDSRVQAAYERQRDLKATYQAVAIALKPALQELAERSVDEMLQKPESHKQANEYLPLIQQLRGKLDNKLRECDKRLECDLNLSDHSFNAERYVADKEFQNAVGDMFEQFYEGQDNRLRILNALHSKHLPVDVRDDQYEFHVISDAFLDNEFGIYESYKNGCLVPYPSRVIGTDMWRKHRKTDAAAAAPKDASSAPGRGRGRGRGGAGTKRRAVDQSEGQSAPKRPARNADDSQLLPPAPMAPAPMKGLLASAANVDEDPEGPQADEESVPASPDPAVANENAPVASRAQTRQLAREKSPPLPKNIGEADDHGVRTYHQRPSMRDKGISSRILAPRPFLFDNWDIGFRDSSNDSSKGHTRAKRGKYLDTPNSNGIHYDHWCNGYDYSTLKPEDFDQEMVKKYGVHPTYGIFLPSSRNEMERLDPYVMPGKPNVFIANPSGRTSHASRSFQATVNERRSEETPWRTKMKANLSRFCKLAHIDTQNISVAEYTEPPDDLRSKSLGTAEQEVKSRPQVTRASPEAVHVEATPEESEQPENGLPGLSLLTYASAFVAAQDTTTRAVLSAPPKSARYDAIRDVFTDTSTRAPRSEDVVLNFFAEICNVESRLPSSTKEAEPATTSTAVPPSSDPGLQRAVQREETPAVASVGHNPAPATVNISQEPPPLLVQSQPDRVSLHSSGSAHERVGYPAPTSQREYRPTAPPIGAPVQDHGTYYPAPPPPPPPHRPSSAYPPDPVPIDPSYNPRRVSSYGLDTSQQPSHSRLYWTQPPHPSGSSGPSPSLPPVGGHPQVSHQAYSLPPPPSGPRISFSQTATAEPLPPLRPPRSRTHSAHEELPYDAPLRGSMHSSYYPLPPSRSYHHGYAGSEPLQPSPLKPLSSDRILPNPNPAPQANTPYMGSSPPASAYASQVMSPTFGGGMGLPGAMMQSPPGTPHGGGPGSAHRHRSTPSGSSDAGSNKYRKLQPAPVPAHRTWSSKPELKTIPYDHKDGGSAAALPSSGPTQIRGWNVNQHRKRSKQDRGDSSHDRDESR